MVALRTYGRQGWWLKVGRWSFGWTADGWGWRPLSERYGTTRSWWWRGWCLRRHGHLDPD